MKVLLYTEGEKLFSKSGLGKAIRHQKKALRAVGVKYTSDIKSKDYDILHLNYYGPKSYKLAKKAKKAGKKVVYHAHSTEEDFKKSFILSEHISPIFKKWLIKCYSLGDVIITPTPYSKRVLTRYGIKRKIYSISNGIELDYFKNEAGFKKEFRSKYGLKSNDKVIIGIGLYIERKGIIDFVKLAKKMPEYKFIWFGHSSLAIAPQKVKKAVKTKLPNLIFAGYVSRENIKKAMWGCDIFLFPTHEETEGIPIIEACACKKTSVIRNIPVFKDWLEEGVNVYKASSLSEFEEKIRKIVNKELPQLGNNAYKVAQERNLNKVGSELKQVYEEVLEKK
ncbi:MAG: glycosyltransferase [Bacilli bacterium]|nr:glycosyltransferase [Bacilli bacterium]